MSYVPQVISWVKVEPDFGKTPILGITFIECLTTIGRPHLLGDTLLPMYVTENVEARWRNG